VQGLARKLTAHYGRRPITIVSILTGSLVMLADLIRQLEMPLRVALIQAHRYRTSGEPRTGLVVNDALLPNLKDRDVLVIDDIFDTGPCSRSRTSSWSATAWTTKTATATCRSSPPWNRRTWLSNDFATEATEFTEKKLQIAKCTLQIENCWKHLFLNVTFAIVILQFAISSL
jgi:hypoxanthine phosphoribosyltransferase